MLSAGPDGKVWTMTRSRLARHALALLLVSSVLATVSWTITTIPAEAAGIRARRVAGGLTDPAGFTFTPSGKTIFFLERATGRIRILNLSTKSVRTFFRISGVDGSGERGALGIALNRDWPDKKLLYVYVTRRDSPTGSLANELVRIRDRSGRGSSMKVLFHSPVSSASNHNGGRILYGPDRKLYIVIGENADPANAQDLTGNVRGKILRVQAAGNRADGRAAKTNPFGNRIWAYGIRNSFGFTFDPQTRRLWETENGPECNDELNVIHRGANYGWGPSESCGGTAPNDTNNSGPAPRLPVYFFPSTLGITGDAFCDGCRLGAGNEGRLFFGDVNDGLLRSVALNGARDDVSGSPTTVLSAPRGVVYSIEVAPNGRIYFSDGDSIYRLVKT
jgi:glucose/arabinose dehydrogenase